MKNVKTHDIKLNDAYRNQKTPRSDMDRFKDNLKRLISQMDLQNKEEYDKNNLRDFLLNTYYADKHYINIKDDIDYVIHSNNSSSSKVQVLIESKRLQNSSEMPSLNNLNSKALQELILYYLRERVTQNNLEIKNLIITNIKEWFIFDATIFENLFFKNKNLVKQFKDFEEKRLSGTDTAFFYNQIAKPLIDEIQSELQFTYFNLDDYKEPLYNNDPNDDNKLISLYKVLSPQHLLKLPFANDSNSLNENFYKELLHIIGLTRVKAKGKELIDRHNESERNPASLLENTITQLNDLDKLSRLENPTQYGNNKDERLFNVALELCITWINRILFLKLLEAQLITYHKGNKDYEFLNNKKIKSYDDLNGLFFQVLAKLQNERNEDVKNMFSNVPYLNSSLFEPTEIEHNALFISNLKDDKQLPIISSTVLKDNNGKKKEGKLNALDYLFDFLNSYDFSSQGGESIQEENKTLINASVLGLIFEKINGYKDGSFFTPGFITEYMCRETIRRAVIQKFNDALALSSRGAEPRGNLTNEENTLKSLDDVYNIIDERGAITRQKANDIINSLTICDPAVGSGHFLVSALNEILAIKNDLRILQDRNGNRLKEYFLKVVNDELIITDENNSLFEYNYQNKESQRVQEAIFHEKQTIIENCLFGVDINPNSVKICRLRLWIELLKHAYYKNDNELETLPNIDINIKCGNSLISRFEIDADLKQALKNSKWDIHSYRNAVATYRNAKSKEQKHDMERLINDIKNDFRTEINKNSKEMTKLFKLEKEQYEKFLAPQLFGHTLTPAQKKKLEEEHKTLNSKIETLKAEIEEIKNNKIYLNAFEWRFEFPEVLNEVGDFVGFDIVIGNPPYFSISKLKDQYIAFEKMDYFTFEKTTDVYCIFYERSFSLLKENGYLSFITSNKWMRAGYGKNLRHLFSQLNPELLIDLGPEVFTNATVDTNLILVKNSKVENHNMLTYTITDYEEALHMSELEFSSMKELNSDSWVIMSKDQRALINKIETVGKPLNEWDISINRGILTGFNEAFIIDGETKDRLIAEDPKSAEILKPILRGRDIKRYKANFADLWLIASHNGYTKDGKRIERIHIEDYPAIKNHLDKYWEAIEKRYDKGDTPYNLRNCAYHEDFQKEKVIYNDITQKLTFFVDLNAFYINNTSYYISGNENLSFIALVLNSSLIDFYYRKISTQLGKKAIRMFTQFVEKIPIPKPTPTQETQITDLVNQILAAKKEDPEANTQDLEDEIDHLVYKLYGLTYDEVLIVDPETKITREEY